MKKLIYGFLFALVLAFFVPEVTVSDFVQAEVNQTEHVYVDTPSVGLLTDAFSIEYFMYNNLMPEHEKPIVSVIHYITPTDSKLPRTSSYFSGYPTDKLLC